MTTATTTPVVCADCGKTIEPPANSCGTGYGTARDGAKVCYECCGKRDAADMRQSGRATLYLSGKLGVDARVTNWPATLVFPVGSFKTGRHNVAGFRFDVWFRGPDNATWHGVQYGRNTEILHCRRTTGG